MPEEPQQEWVRSPQVRPQTLALVALTLGLVVALSNNVVQSRKITQLAQDVDSARDESHKQVAELRKAQTALLEQDLLRLDQMNTELHNASLDQDQQAASLARRTRSELARSIEQRHQEMITAISDLRADLRSEASAHASPAKPAQVNPVERVQVDIPPPLETPPPPSDSLVSNEQSQAQPPVSPAAQKRHFWSKLKLNMFRNRNKRRDDDDSSVAQ